MKENHFIAINSSKVNKALDSRNTITLSVILIAIGEPSLTHFLDNAMDSYEGFF